MFITFEGIEGCGKTTQIKLLGDFLRSKGFPCVITREPGGTGIGEKIREILLSPQNSEMDHVTELLLYMASRAQHIEEVIRPSLAKKKVVLCDRFSDATIAYQGYGRGFDLQWLRKLDKLAASGLRPDTTILLDCPVEIGLARAMERVSTQESQMTTDRLEMEDISFHRRVREGYLEIAGDEDVRVVVVDGAKQIDIVHEDICKIMSSKMTGS